jgi:hypothetical protein
VDAENAARRCGLHFDSTLALVDQIKNVGSRLEPLYPFFQRPLFFGVRIRERPQQTLDKGMPGLFPSTAAFTAAPEVLVSHLRPNTGDVAVTQPAAREDVYLIGFSLP